MSLIYMYQSFIQNRNGQTIYTHIQVLIISLLRFQRDYIYLLLPAEIAMRRMDGRGNGTGRGERRRGTNSS